MEEKKKIIFIEDSRSFQDAISRAFKERGYEIVSAYDGESGVKLIESEKPDLIFLDLIVPKKDGFQVLEEIKNSPSLSKIPVAVLTNLESSLEIGRAFSLGAQAYLVKANYTLSDLIKKAEEILNKHEHNQ